MIYIYILLPEQRLTGKISQKTWSSWLPNSSLQVYMNHKIINTARQKLIYNNKVLIFSA